MIHRYVDTSQIAGKSEKNDYDYNWSHMKIDGVPNPEILALNIQTFLHLTGTFTSS